ncbi:MAG: rRNA maturation RNase YbeY [Clostridia bacterium]|nr:rRNA maturation RNase YbeY [Clostridia bacterium]
MKVKLNITNAQDIKKLPFGTKALVKKACKATLTSEEFKEPAEINVTFVDDKEIQRLNNEFRNLDKSTDVLSFPLGEDGVYDVNPETNALMLGDVVISIEHALAQAEVYGHGVKREIAFLTVHSVLHLLGYDHVNSDEEDMQMRAKQNTVLKNMGLDIKNK